MNNFHVVTVATESKHYFPYLVESCKKHGKELEVLGYGEKWQGFNWRYVKMIEYLKTLPNDHIVCFVDGYDVICCRDLNEISKVFLEIKEKTGCKMIVGHAKTSTLTMVNNYMIFGSCNGNLLNAGTYIGYVEDLLVIIESIFNLNPKNEADDQVLLTKYCKRTNDINCDTKSELFLTLCYELQDVSKFVTIDKKTNVVSYKNENPFFIHAASCGFLNKMLTQLGYSVDGEIKNELTLYLIKKFFIFHLFRMIKDNLFIIIIIIAIIYKRMFIYNFIKSHGKKLLKSIKK